MAFLLSLSVLALLEGLVDRRRVRVEALGEPGQTAQRVGRRPPADVQGRQGLERAEVLALGPLAGQPFPRLGQVFARLAVPLSESLP